MMGEWNDGFIANYFQIIEASANSNFKRICRRIEANNAAIEKGQAGEFGRKIALKVLQAEVPMHYLVNFSQDRLVECVNLGVQTARKWCKEQGLALRPGEDAPTQVQTAQTKLQFSEVMKGFLAQGQDEFEAGFAQGKADGMAASFSLTIKMDGVDRFVTDPKHEAAAEGYIDCAAFGGKRPVSNGSFNLFVESGGNPHHKKMLYRLWFEDAQGKPLTLLGYKDVKDDPGFDVWSDTTTLYTRILEGHCTFGKEGKCLAAGVLKLHMTDFLKELTTFRVEGPTIADRSSALARFGQLFLGKLWDVYASHLLVYGPI
jgi:hypothetical protein